MDTEQFLQQLCDLPLEEGRTYIQMHAAELAEHASISVRIADEALHQRDVNPFVSLKLAELLIFFGDYVYNAKSHALGLKAKGVVLDYMGHCQAARECLDNAGEEFLRLGDEVQWARTRISAIISSAWLGHIEEALQEAAHAREVLLQHGEYYWACILDHNTAVIYTQMGRYQKALELYDRMLSIYPTLPDQGGSSIQSAIAKVEVNQARNLSWLGNFGEAYRLLEKARASFIALEETSQIINAEYNLAELDYAQGYYGSALRRYYQLRDSSIQHNFDELVMASSNMLRMAVCLVKLNRAQEACQLAVQAVEACRKAATPLSTGEALREYATMLVASDRAPEALLALNEAWTLFHTSGLDHHAFATRLQQAELLLETGQATEAYEQACGTKEYFDAQGLVPQSLRADLVMAGALIKSIHQTVGPDSSRPSPIDRPNVPPSVLQEAVSLCKQTAYLARRHNLQEQDYQSHHLLGQLAAIAGNLTNASRHYGIAISQIECILDDLAYDLSPSFLHTTWTVYEDMIALCLQQKKVERAFSYLERARSLTLRRYLNKAKGVRLSLPDAHSATVLQMQHELERWQEKYHKYSRQLADIDTPMAPRVEQEAIQYELKRCEAKISELFERLHLQQVATDLTSSSQAPGRKKRPEIARVSNSSQHFNVEQIRQRLLPGELLLAYYLDKSKLVIFALTPEGLSLYENPNGGTQLERLLPLLHAHLQPGGWSNPQQPPQEAIRRLLSKLYNLLIAPVANQLQPSGRLTIVPYGPLHTLPFHALYNGSHFLIEDVQVSYLPASNMLMHLHCDKDERKQNPTKPPLVFGYSGNGHLQRVLDEAQTLATLLDGQSYLEGDATIARLLEEAYGSPIIHIATHGHSRLDAPNFSYVRLADGQLNAIDAFSLNLEGCELVTLSGCETGLALSGGGDEQLGLGRAFLAAGVASLVISLWPVEDNATKELMQLFYARLLKGDSKVQALRAAQCTLLHRLSPSYTHPYFWASFRLVGDAGPLQYERHSKEDIFEFEPLKK